ncbi:restriction endonuclease subunit S [Dolichospermum planctonicum CS-1226]|uniref:Restriction endonuclease subunit S n=1 Tax=Dolichospermum planctonicum CS-1226 TaxID=3021751 RepID=A0ABT5AH17_9CYAN|nr:restriction endonuclease subunit S [Dolichospermum planctonicum]MDB9536579.1 restriction endonuclease subunit S [Dolichospermum planctonicum CS-1226]
MNNWKDLYWGDLITLEYGKPCPNYADNIGEYPVFGTNGKIGQSKKALCNHPSVIIGRKGAYRGVHYSDKPFWVIDTAFYLEPKVDIDLKWAYYNLLTQDINGMDSGSAIPSTSRQDFYFLSVKLPPLSEQKAIAHILSSLDDKIELNRQMNETLEAMARAIFKSWFVDFDPVRAKSSGRQPAGMDTATADLFPDEFEESSLGLIPKGWKIKALPEFIEINPKRSLAKGKIAPYLDMKNMPTQGHRPDDWIDRPFGSGTKFINGDTLMARITPCLENGKTAFVDFLQDKQVCWGSTEYIIFRSKPPLPLEFAYYLARHEEFKTFAIQNMTGSSGRQRTPADCFHQYLIAVPSEQVALKFGDLVEPLMVMISANSEQSQNLINLRDTLLPKLMSGEIRVKEAEKIINDKL